MKDVIIEIPINKVDRFCTKFFPSLSIIEKVESAKYDGMFCKQFRITFVNEMSASDLVMFGRWLREMETWSL